MFGIVSNDLLLAIPFFTFMGTVLERTGLAEDLLESAGQLFGTVPGGLAYSVIIVGAIFGAISGTIAASVIALGMIALPAMLRYGYHVKTATGVIAATGTITQLVPPSLTLLVLADQLGKPVGDMYAGAIGPSIAQTLHLHAVHPRAVVAAAAVGAAAAAGGAHAARLGAARARAVGRGSGDEPHLPRARHDLPRPRHADRGGRHGGGRRHRARGGARAPQPRA